MNAGHCGASAAPYTTCKTKREDNSDEALSNKTGHAALSACVGDLTFSCKDAASPSTQLCDRGVLKRNKGIKSLIWNTGLHRMERDEASVLYTSKPQPEYGNLYLG